MSQQLHQPEHCWSLERVPWWEPPYILHSGKEEVKLGRSKENSKVVRGHQVSRQHATFIRLGNPEDWKTARWTLLDKGSGQGTYVNQVRVDSNQPLPLNADDLIGFGCSDSSSSRTKGKETFVYRIRAPAAFLSLETDEDSLDVPDSEAPTPPPMADTHDYDLINSLTPDDSPSSQQQASTSNKSSPNTSHGDISSSLDIITIDTTDDDKSKSPVENHDNNKPASKRQLKDRDSSPQEHQAKKFKQLFGSDDEAKEEESEELATRKVCQNKTIESLKRDDAFSNLDLENISSDEEPGINSKAKELRNVGFDQAMDLSNKAESVDRSVLSQPCQSQAKLQEPRVAKNKPRRDQETKNLHIDEAKKPLNTEAKKPIEETKPTKVSNEDSFLEDLAAKIIAKNKETLSNSPNQLPTTDEKPMVTVKMEFPLVENIKKEPTDFVPLPKLTKGYSEEPDVITLDDSDDEDTFAKSFNDGDGTLGQTSVTFEDNHEPAETFDDSDDEVQILSMSETSLYAAISRRVKVEYEDKSSEESECDQDKTMEELVSGVIAQVGCDRANVLEAIETAKELFMSSSPTISQVVEVLAGTEEDNNVPDDNVLEAKPLEKESVKDKRKKHPSNGLSTDDIADLLGDDSDEDDFVQTKPKEKPKKKRKSSEGTSRRNSRDVEVPRTSEGASTSPGSSKPAQQPTFNKRIKIPKLSKAAKEEEERRKMLEDLKDSRPKQSESELRKEIRQQRLAEIAKKQSKSTTEVRDHSVPAPAGVMKASVPKSQRLLQDMNSTDSSKPKRKAVDPRKKEEDKRRALEEARRLKAVKSQETKVSAEKSPESSGQDNLYQQTYDGYKVPKKMSVANVQYMDHNQAAPKPAVKETAKPTTQTVPKPILRKKGCQYPGKKISWKDKCLVMVREIPAENVGKKVGAGNNKDGSVKVKVAPVVASNVSTNNDKKIITTDDIILYMLHWNPAWLEEQKVQTEPPPVHHPWQLIPVTSTFSSWQEYRRIFLPLMLQELWSNVSRDYEERKAGCSSIPVMLQEVVQDHGGQFVTVRCLAVMSAWQLQSDLCSEGSLVQLDVKFTTVTKDGKRATQVKPSFAYIWFVTRPDLLKRDDNSIGEMDKDRIKKLQAISVKAHGPAAYNHLLHITLKLKQNLIPPDCLLSVDKPVKMKTLSRVKPELRKFTAMLELPQSRLFESIINPSRELLAVRNVGTNLHASITNLSALSRLNPKQKEIIVGVSQACVQYQDMAKVSLIQGPPGTGKTSTITGLILQILYSSMTNNNIRTSSRILVVAPSNAAVDQLALKLIEIQGQLPEKIRFKLLRLGVNSSMHHDVKPFSFDAVVEQQRNVHTRANKASDSIDKDIATKTASAEWIWGEVINAQSAGKTDLAGKLKRDYHEVKVKLDKLKEEAKRPLSHKSRKDVERVAVEKTLAEADVILTTLSSSLASYTEKYLVHGAGTSKSVGPLRPVSVCIIDEASQCVEPEALIPLKYGFCKLVMVGDHEQLPATVTSRKAQQLDYQQSLFSRLISCMSANPGPSPVQRLDTQYRMHPSVADWPARYFYGGKLSNGAHLRPVSLSPYHVLDVVGDTLQADGACWNKKEEKVVIATIEAVKTLVREELSIGVITFYAKQKQNILAEVKKRRWSSSQVVVNTVDGFQGSERDVIIISCVRSGAGSIGFLQDRQRLNVALTRAKHCLVLIGDINALRRATPMWSEFVSNAESRRVVMALDGDNSEAAITKRLVTKLRK